MNKTALTFFIISLALPSAAYAATYNITKIYETDSLLIGSFNAAAGNCTCSGNASGAYNASYEYWYNTTLGTGSSYNVTYDNYVKNNRSNSSIYWYNIAAPLASWTETFNSTYDAKPSNVYNASYMTNVYNSSYLTAETLFLGNWSYLHGKPNNTYNASYATDRYNASYMTSTFNSTYDAKPSDTYNATYCTASNGLCSASVPLAIPQLIINGTNSTHVLTITPKNNTSTSTSSGGAVFIDNSKNNGSAVIIYSTAGAESNARLMNIRNDNGAFAGDGFNVNYNGTGTAMSVSSMNSRAGTSSQALDVVSKNVNYSAMGVSGYENNHGTLKITHYKPDVDDSDAAGLSINIADAGTHAQGIWVYSTGNTTGNAFTFQNENLIRFSIDRGGRAFWNDSITNYPYMLKNDTINNSLYCNGLVCGTANYQFTSNSFNGSGNFNTSGNIKANFINATSNLTTKYVMFLNSTGQLPIAGKGFYMTDTNIIRTTGSLQVLSISVDNGFSNIVNSTNKNNITGFFMKPYSSAAATLACGATTEGFIMYNSSSKKMCFCDATSWKNYTGGAC